MKAQGLPFAPRKTTKTIKRRAEDNEFLAPALEILESPVSPIRALLLRTICCFTVVAILWSWFGRIDVIAVAQGKFEPTGRVKVIQPLVTGKVMALKVAEGSHVLAGDVLVELDRAEIEADRNAAVAELQSATAEATRRRVAISTVKTGKVDTLPVMNWAESVAVSLRDREQQNLVADFGQLSATVASLKAQREQRNAEIDKLKDTISAQASLVDTEQQRVDMMQTLLESQAGARLRVIDATETLKTQETQLAIQQQQLASLEVGISVLDREIDKALNGFIQENSQKLSDAERQIENIQQQVAKAEATISNLTLKSPIDGTIQALTITNLGQVLTTGQDIMRVVPENSALEIEAYVLNADIGFVKEGQEAALKIDSFPFTRYGTVKAHVKSIAHDAIPEPDASLIEGDPTRAPSNSGFAGAQRTQNLVFPVTLVPDVSHIDADGRSVSLTPGMSATVEFKTGSRRILEYFFSPLVELASDALKER